MLRRPERNLRAIFFGRAGYIFMSKSSATWVDHQRKRFMRPDAARYVRPDTERYRRPDPRPRHEDSTAFFDTLYGRKYSPDQPREPAGSSTGGRFAGGARKRASNTRLAFAGPAATAARATIQLGLMLYTMMSARNGPDQQTVAEFKANEFRSDETRGLELSNVRQLDRDQVDAACPRLGEVQARTDAAAEAVKNDARIILTPQQYGTAVHLNLKNRLLISAIQISSQKNRCLRQRRKQTMAM
jgi:hypothetical protein